MLKRLHRSKNTTLHNFLRGQKGLRGFIWEKDAPAQGMVEFALVLPVLLMVIFGIVAFGHFFFNYSLVVAASRDAARFGAAVGLTENSLPRYRDCNEIRYAAIASGKFAGVENTTTSINITYDKGPKADGTAADPVVDDDTKAVIQCGVDQIGPGLIELGDRIVVTVTTQYRPIVPIIPVESIPLTATTRRTIMLGMPVGDLAIAEKSKCVGTLTRIVSPNYDDTLLGSVSRVGEVVNYPYEVITDDPDETAQGTLYFYVDDLNYATPVDTIGAPIGNYQRTWDTLTPLNDPIILQAKYDPGTYATTTPCYDPSKAEPLRHFVISAETVTTILDLTTTDFVVGEPVTINVEVAPGPPSTVGKPTGQVVVSGEGIGESCTITLTPDPDPTKNKSFGSCDLTFASPNNNNTITAVYDKDPGTDPLFNSSSDSVDVDVDPAPTEEPTVSCPAFQAYYELNGDSILLFVDNANSYQVELDRIDVVWKSSNSLSYVYFGNSTTPVTVLKAPPSATVQLDGLLDVNSTTPLRLQFDSQLTSGTYSVTGILGTWGGTCPTFSKEVTVPAYP